MKYDCLLHVDNRAFCVAKAFAVDRPDGPEKWGPDEGTWDGAKWVGATIFEMIQTEELYPSEEDYAVDLHASWGWIQVWASQIDPKLAEAE